jgi:16S rRNA (adenine1518-N6/adenine1519-N6)-dimethyltransferase
MVQKELGERLFASPSTKAYSAVSVLTQLACRVEKVRPVPASAFRPQPRVESSFVSFVRREAPEAPDPAEYATVSHLVRLAFGQRRKTLVNSLGGVAHAGATLGREDVRAALVRLTLGESARPEELTPAQWRTFAAELGRVAAAGPAA